MYLNWSDGSSLSLSLPKLVKQVLILAYEMWKCVSMGIRPNQHGRAAQDRNRLLEGAWERVPSH